MREQNTTTMNLFRSKTTILIAPNSIKHSALRRALLLVPFMLACFALSPQARADCQQGCDTVNNANTFLGEDALLNHDTVGNTAVGYHALMNPARATFYNTAVGASALEHNTVGNSNTATGSNALLSNTKGRQ